MPKYKNNPWLYMGGGGEAFNVLNSIMVIVTH